MKQQIVAEAATLGNSKTEINLIMILKLIYEGKIKPIINWG